MTIWMHVTRDEYHLPLGVYNSAREMSIALKVPVNNIFSYIGKAKAKGFKYPKYVKVEIDDEENDA